jgi:hypothetical protein
LSQTSNDERQAAARAERRAANGRAGKGRKSAAGRAQSAKNAFRHGLNLPLLVDPAASAEVAALTRAILASAREGPSSQSAPEFVELAQRFAEAQLDLVRVRRARHDLIADALADPDYVPSRLSAQDARRLQNGIKIAERAGCSQLRHEFVTALGGPPSGPDRHAQILADLAPRLAAMDRYERYARTRRKLAIRCFDEERLRLWIISTLG